jgi:uncharacterized coiled-coil DUF342 family protein
VEEKDGFKKINDKLKTKLKRLKEVREQLDKNKVELFRDKKKREEKSLKEKAKEAKEKLSKRKKLTTEDLLVLQRVDK